MKTMRGGSLILWWFICVCLHFVVCPLLVNAPCSLFSHRCHAAVSTSTVVVHLCVSPVRCVSTVSKCPLFTFIHTLSCSSQYLWWLKCCYSTASKLCELNFCRVTIKLLTCKFSFINPAVSKQMFGTIQSCCFPPNFCFLFLHGSSSYLC